MEIAEEIDALAPEAAADAYELPPEEERTAWYEPGLLRRIGRRRRVERAPRRSLRQRLHDRGLHFGPELVAGVFVAVLVVALGTIAVLDLRAGGTSTLVPSNEDAAGPGAAQQQAQPQATATPLCIAAPIPGSALRPCAH